MCLPSNPLRTKINLCVNLQLILSLRGISIVYNKTAEELTINL